MTTYISDRFFQPFFSQLIYVKSIKNLRFDLLVGIFLSLYSNPTPFPLLVDGHDDQ
jgi:hypothetical protein